MYENLKPKFSSAFDLDLCDLFLLVPGDCTILQSVCKRYLFLERRIFQSVRINTFVCFTLSNYFSVTIYFVRIFIGSFDLKPISLYLFRTMNDKGEGALSRVKVV